MAENNSTKLRPWNKGESWHSYLDTVRMWRLSVANIPDGRIVPMVINTGIQPNYKREYAELVRKDPRFWVLQQDAHYLDDHHVPDLGPAVRGFSPLGRLTRFIENMGSVNRRGARELRMRNITSFERRANESERDAFNRYHTLVLECESEEINEQTLVTSLFYGLQLGQEAKRAIRSVFRFDQVGQIVDGHEQNYNFLRECIEDLILPNAVDENKNSNQKKSDPSSSSNSPPPPNESANYANNKNKNSKNNKGNKNNSYSNNKNGGKGATSSSSNSYGTSIICWGCGKKGHYQRECWGKGKGKGKKGGGSGKSNTGLFGPRQYQRAFLASGEEVFVCLEDN